MQLDRALLARMWPHAPAPLVDAVAAHSAQVLARYQVNTALRLAHFLAQVSHESDGGTVTAENMNYRTAQRIAAVWPTRFTAESAQEYVGNPQKLASKVYNGRMGNRPGTDDGYAFRGRGLLQITGRESYRAIGALTGLDLEGEPDLAFAPDTALEVAACEFQKLGCLPACDSDDVRGVTKRVNGGYIGLESRKAWLARWKQALPELPGEPDAVEDNERPPRGAEEKSTLPTPPVSPEQGTAVTVASGGGAGVVQQLQPVADQLEPLRYTVKAVQYVLIAIALIGVVATLYAMFHRKRTGGA